MKSNPEAIELDEADLQSKLNQIEAAMGADMARPFRLLLQWYACLLELLRQKKLSIRRLRKMLFGASTERTSNVLPSSAESSGQAEDRSAENTADGPAGGDGTLRRRRPRNHGRIAASRYTGCEKVVVTHASLHSGDNCPHCGSATVYLAHGRRNFVEVVEDFPAEVRHVLESLKKVYKTDAEAKKEHLSPDERLKLHQEQSGPVMNELHRWLKAQFEEKLVEPNSSLGGAISYMIRHWQELTLFLRVRGAPLDNNVCERALKMAIRHRKNSLFYKTQRGAEVGDLYMSLIHTCYSSGVSPVDYLTEIQRNHQRVRLAPGDWLPWNYRAQLVAAESEASGGRGPPCQSVQPKTRSPHS
jgi:transposase